jgi:hypothetical protein
MQAVINILEEALLKLKKVVRESDGIEKDVASELSIDVETTLAACKVSKEHWDSQKKVQRGLPPNPPFAEVTLGNKT